MVDDIIVRALLDEGLYPPLPPEPVEEIEIADRPPGGVAVTVRNLTKAFGPHTVLHGIDLHVPPGGRSAISISSTGSGGSGG